MTRQNRVLPTGDIVATPERGLFMGNRGILHDDAGQLGRKRWNHPHWVCCVLSFKGRKRPLMQPNRYTELFFLDEAVALAAGHRPCAECRRADYNRWCTAWEAAFGTAASAGEMNKRLHRDRVHRDRTQIRFEDRFGNLPDGTFVLLETGAHLVVNGGARPFSPGGYGVARTVEPNSDVCVLTPHTCVAVLKAGYRPELHPSATP